jgi:hypothetical protein
MIWPKAVGQDLKSGCEVALWLVTDHEHALQVILQILYFLWRQEFAEDGPSGHRGIDVEPHKIRNQWPFC